MRAERAVHLVGAHLDEAAHPGAASSVEQHLGPGDVRLDEDARPQDAAVDVALRREVDDGLRLVTPEQLVDEPRIRDVALDEHVVRVFLQIGERLEIAGVRQLVEVDDGQARTLAPEVPDEVRADEPGPAGDQDGGHHFRSGSEGVFARPVISSFAE